MYCCFDNEHLIAWHEKKRVVHTYAHSIEMHTELVEPLCIIKMGKGDFHRLYKNQYDELYLVKYGETYIQSGYLIYAQLALDTETQIKDLQSAQETLMRILEINLLTKKEKKDLYRTIQLLDHMIVDYEDYVPNLTELKRMKIDYDPYIYNNIL